MGPTWGPPGSCRPQMGPMLAPWTLLSGNISKCPTLCWWRWFQIHLLGWKYIPYTRHRANLDRYIFNLIYSTIIRILTKLTLCVVSLSGNFKNLHRRDVQYFIFQTKKQTRSEPLYIEWSFFNKYSAPLYNLVTTISSAPPSTRKSIGFNLESIKLTKKTICLPNLYMLMPIYHLSAQCEWTTNDRDTLRHSVCSTNSQYLSLGSL